MFPTGNHTIGARRPKGRGRVGDPSTTRTRASCASLGMTACGDGLRRRHAATTCADDMRRRPVATTCADDMRRRPVATACGDGLRRRPAATVSPTKKPQLGAAPAPCGYKNL
ncbi:MAG: hypothetical protein LBF55_02840 [Prevotellaceae bacterium]|nr:hypothetical protein [Prevotellaceae bacterium]